MNGRASGPTLGVAAGTLAIVCCAGLPAIDALTGGITIAGVIGIAGGVLVLVALGGGAILFVRAHRRRASYPPTTGGRIE